MKRRESPLRVASAATAAAAALAGFATVVASPMSAGADACSPLPPVFTSDPCNPITGPYPMLPGVPLVLPQDGPTGSWRSGPPSVVPSFFGDVDLAVRVGPFVSDTEVPYPAESPGGPSIQTKVAGGGGTGQGDLVPFTVFVTDGPGSFPYGVPLPGLDERPVAVFAYADLDDDGRVGPSDSDPGGNADNALEKLEALGQIGRQVGQIDGDRLVGTMAVRVGAPASIGGLRVALVSGMYTGDDPMQLWSNGTPIFTKWPFFPPLDPLRVVFLEEANPPDPSGPNIVFYQTPEFYLPPPSQPNLTEAFAVFVDGTSPSTDQYISVSGDAVSARLFRNADPSGFVAGSRLTARVAPLVTGSGRTLVVPAGELAVEAGEMLELRLLPVDALGNIADPSMTGLGVRVESQGGLRILSPDLDDDPEVEDISLTTARGVTLFLSTTDIGNGTGRLSISEAPPVMDSVLDQAVVAASTSGPVDTDDDGVPDDGDGSGILGDAPCSAQDVIDDVACDDNCPRVVNPAQSDSDEDGQGNCCDGTCVLDDEEEGCIECPQAASRFRGLSTRARAAIQPRGGLKPDVVRLRSVLRLDEGQDVAPDSEAVEVTLAEGDRLHYFVQLPGSFELKNGRPTWIYSDPTGAIGGVLRAQVRGSAAGMRMRLMARGMNLVDTLPAEELSSGLVLAVTIGDDTFVRRLSCGSTLKAVRCASAD